MNTKKSITAIFIGIIFLINSVSEIKAIEHPHVVYNQLEISDLKNRITLKEEPLTSHYQKLKNDSAKSGTGNSFYGGNDPKLFREGLDIDGPIAFSNAMLYALDKNELNAKRARDLLVLWSDSLSQVRSYNDFSDASGNKEAAGMFLGRAMFQLVPAYDLIYNSSELSSQDKVKINAWLSKVSTLLKEGMVYWFDPKNKILCHNYSNHVSAQITGLMLIGYMFEDNTIINEAISGSTLPTSWKNLMSYNIYMKNEHVIGCDIALNNPTYTGEVVDRYRHFEYPNTDPALKLNRGLGYSLLSTYNLALGAEAAYHHGVDLYHFISGSGETLIFPGIYYAYFPKTFGPNDTLITATNYNGEISYVNEMYQADFIKLYELLTFRFENNISLANAFSKYNLASRANYNYDYIFGKNYQYDQINWDFFLDGNDEGWVTPTNLVTNGAMQITTRSTDLKITSPALNIRASDYKYLTVKYKASGGGTNTATVSWGPSKSTSYSVVADNQMREYKIDLSKIPSWNGIITQLDILPINISGSTLVIDSIRLHNDIQSIPTPKQGDLNNDNKIDLYDFNLAITNYGNPYTLEDYNSVVSNFGK